MNLNLVTRFPPCSDWYDTGCIDYAYPARLGTFSYAHNIWCFTLANLGAQAVLLREVGNGVRDGCLARAFFQDKKHVASIDKTQRENPFKAFCCNDHSGQSSRRGLLCCSVLREGGNGVRVGAQCWCSLAVLVLSRGSCSGHFFTKYSTVATA